LRGLSGRQRVRTDGRFLVELRDRAGMRENLACMRRWATV